MNTSNTRTYWACRRGMLELDLLLIPFYQHRYSQLSSQQQQDFVRLLACDDPELYEWLTDKSIPEDKAFATLITLIRDYAQHKN